MIAEKNGSIFSNPMLVMSLYAMAITGAEATGVFVDLVLGILGHGLLFLTLLSHYALQDQAPYRPALPVLALLPLLRILSITTPMRQLPQIYWFVLVGVPLLVAVVLTIRLLGRPWASWGLRASPWLPQLLIALHGLPFGLAAYLILKPAPFMVQFNWLNAALGSLILIIFTGFTEELIFRGLLQQVASETFGRAGILYSSALFAVMYMGSLSWSYVLFMGLVGLFFGWCVRRTGSIGGVILAHSLLNIGLIIIWPTLV